MDEKSLRSLLELAAAEHEPPTAAIVGNSLAAGRRQRRRRRILGAAGGLAVLGAVAVGVPALAGSLGQPPQEAPVVALPPAAGSSSSAGSSSPSAPSSSAPAVPIPAWWHFVTPVVPAQQLTGDLVPVTAQSAELLLLDELPASATPSVSSQTATTDDAGLVAGQVDVTSPRGSGTVLVSMSAPGAAKVGGCGSQGSDSGSEPADLACRDFHLPGDVTVQESLLGMAPSPGSRLDSYLVSVTVQRANGLWVTIEAASYAFDSATESGQSTGVPLSVARIVKAAADPRWARQMPRSFVAQAVGVQLPSPTPKG